MVNDRSTMKRHLNEGKNVASHEKTIHKNFLSISLAVGTNKNRFMRKNEIDKIKVIQKGHTSH